MTLIRENSIQQINAALQALNNKIESLRSQSKMIDSKQVNSDWNATSGPAQILNKPTIPEVTYSLNEHKIGKWVDDSDLYEKTIVLNIPVNGDYEVSTGVSDLKNLAYFTGIFYQGSMSNPQWCMHIPYTYIDTSNEKFLKIYVYYDPNKKSFQCSFDGTYLSQYCNGEAYITFRYTKK